MSAHTNTTLCRLVTDFVDKVLRENASRASAKEPPLTYREARERWADTLEKRAGYGARPGSAAHNQQRDGHSNNHGGNGGPSGNSGGNRGGGNSNRGNQRQRGGIQARTLNARTTAGEPVCFLYNRKSGCPRPKKNQGCEDARGNGYIHVCNYETGPGKYCLATHARHAAH